ncbi:unnamed protein product [Larinioides sclopetarius]|uniref:Uncharacterized protein n=1 Tax=Larinioides sclopetarius TaxID=280406 RepID=A0AAV2B4T6_9ARAC
MTSMPEVNVASPPTSENSESSPLALQSVPYDWAENFVIPWKNMSDSLMKPV